MADKKDFGTFNEIAEQHLIKVLADFLPEGETIDDYQVEVKTSRIVDEEQEAERPIEERIARVERLRKYVDDLERQIEEEQK